MFLLIFKLDVCKNYFRKGSLFNLFRWFEIKLSICLLVCASNQSSKSM